MNSLINAENEALLVMVKEDNVKKSRKQLSEYRNMLKNGEEKIKFLGKYLHDEYEFIKISRGITSLGYTKLFDENPVECYELVKEKLKNPAINKKVKKYITKSLTNNSKNQYSHVCPKENVIKIMSAIKEFQRLKYLENLLDEIAMKPVKTYKDLCKQIEVLESIKKFKISEVERLEAAEKPNGYSLVDFSIEVKSRKVYGEYLKTLEEISVLKNELKGIEYTISKYKKLKEEIGEYINSLDGIDMRIAKLWRIENMKISQIALELDLSEDTIKQRTRYIQNLFN